MIPLQLLSTQPVALRKESVDRNGQASRRASGAAVALRKESVDRNKMYGQLHQVVQASLSARRAWIEIRRASGAADINDVALRKESVDRNHQHLVLGAYGLAVALRKESVDRNLCHPGLGYIGSRSLSARRAWIEILDTLVTTHAQNRRSPQGERG